MYKFTTMVLEDLVSGTADYIVWKKSFRKGVANMLFDTITMGKDRCSISYKGKELVSWKTPEVDFEGGSTLSWRISEGVMKVRLT
jgi:hypothetical protein